MQSSKLEPPFARRDALVRLARTLERDGYRHITVSPATHARVVSRPGRTRARSVRDVFGWSLPFQTDTLSPSLLDGMREAGVLEQHEAGWQSTVRFSSLDDKLHVHSAFPTDSADAVFFGPDTYRYVRAIHAHLRTRATPVERAADIGCGAGPGAIAIARCCPQAQVHALDINPAALRATEINALVSQVDNVVTRESNLFAAVDGMFDLIVANPPYLNDPGRRAYRHGGGDLGAGLSLAILEAARSRLNPGGTLLLYTGVAIVDGLDAFRQHAAGILAEPATDWHYEEIDPDVFSEELDTDVYSSADRIAAVVLTATRRP